MKRHTKINRLISGAERVGALRWVPTGLFLRMKYRRLTGHSLNLRSPRTYMEKMQKLKMIYRKSPDIERYTQMADKLAAKQLAAEWFGEEYVIPTYGVWDSFDEIDFSKLPDRFVLKTNHDSGGIIVCTDKAKLNIERARHKLEKSMRRNFYWFGREPQYKAIKPRIFAEAYVEHEGDDLPDYKLFCFNGKFVFALVCFDRFTTGLKKNYYDCNWGQIPMKSEIMPNSQQVLPKPQYFEQMIRFAEKAAEGIPLLRVDFYEANGRLYFGEFTFFPSSGFQGFDPDSYNTLYGDMIGIPDYASK